ncbi:hypothetical protein QUB77_15565 [Microcoleus sp. AT9b-C3]
MTNIKSDSIVWPKMQSKVNNHGRGNRNFYNLSALICVNLPISAVKKRECVNRPGQGMDAD